MKKIIYAFLSCCVCQNAFADSPSGVYQNQHVNSILIPRIILQNVLIQDDLISQTPGAVEKMMAKYDKLAGPLGQEPLTVNDITQICVESGVITQKEDCLNRVFNPVLAEMGKVRFMNTCSGKITGGNNHCVDDVFVEGKKQNGNQYHQDVNVNPYAANGFAIEYAKKKGHDVWCSSEVKDSTVLCTTLDNKEFYSVKFKGTNNTTDSTIEKNLVKGICALTNTKYIDKGFHGIKSDGSMGLDVDIESSQGCLMKCDLELISKFALTGKTEQRKFNDIDDKYHDFCSMHIVEHLTTTLNRYPGYEYMTDAFKNIQVVLDSKLVDVLKSYVKIQGINVSSFECDYSSKKYDTSATYLGDMLNISIDDVLDCRINGTPVSFVFDDLYEPKEWEQNAGQAAMQCILAGGDYGSDRICSGLTKQKCLSPEVQSMVPGGTRWDSKAEVCLLNRAENARTISNALQVGGGIALAIVFTPTGMPFVALAAVGGSVALDMAFIGVERLNILEPASRARQFATDAQKCEIPIGSKHPSCSQQQVDCAWRVVNQHFARLDEVLDRLNPDQLSLVSDLMENTTDCLSNDLLSSAVKMSTPNAWDKALNKANAFLLVAGIFIQPEKGVMRITENAPKVARILSRCKMVESVSTRLDNTRYLRIYVDNIGQDDIRALATDFRNNGAYVSTKLYKAEDGTHFMAVAEKDIFSKLDDVLNGLDPNFTKGTSLDMDDLRTQLEFTADDLYYNRVIEGDETVTQGMLPDVSTAINKHYAQERNFLFFDPASDQYVDDLIEQVNNTQLNPDKVITGVVDMTKPNGKAHLERAIQTIETGGIKDAVIPIGATKHQMTLIKQGDDWTLLDQYAYKNQYFKSTKDDVISIVTRQTRPTERIVTNIGNICENTTGSCALFSQGMGRIVLEETDGINIANEIRYLNNNNIPMNQNIVDGIVDQMDRDVGLRVLDMLKEE